jgi:hypothetical protein
MLFMHIDDFTPEIREKVFSWVPSEDVNIFVLNDFLETADVVGPWSVFGPFADNDVTLFVDEDKAEWHRVVSKLGCFKSNSEAQKAGWRKPIPDGFVDRMRVAKKMPFMRLVWSARFTTLSKPDAKIFRKEDIAKIRIRTHTTMWPEMEIK